VDSLVIRAAAVFGAAAAAELPGSPHSSSGSEIPRCGFEGSAAATGRSFITTADTRTAMTASGKGLALSLG